MRRRREEMLLRGEDVGLDHMWNNSLKLDKKKGLRWKCSGGEHQKRGGLERKQRTQEWGGVMGESNKGGLDYNQHKSRKWNVRKKIHETGEESIQRNGRRRRGKRKLIQKLHSQGEGAPQQTNGGKRESAKPPEKGGLHEN